MGDLRAIRDVGLGLAWMVLGGECAKWKFARCSSALAHLE
jgi:hypothetical protein